MDDTIKYAKGDLTILVNLGDKHATVAFRGESDARDPAPFLTEVTRDLVPKLAGKKVRVDFKSLKYMNSATVAAILILVRALDQARVPSVLDYDTNVGWQRVNFNCMKAISATLKYVVDVVGSDKSADGAEASAGGAHESGRSR